MPGVVAGQEICWNFPKDHIEASQTVRGPVVVNGAFSVGAPVGLPLTPVHAISLAAVCGYAAEPYGRQPSVSEPQPAGVPAEGRPFLMCHT
ncbi:hypothetical protein GCM10020220_007010 [Nonomuraea rubra]